MKPQTVLALTLLSAASPSLYDSSPLLTAQLAATICSGRVV
jgi:hypothetical protein